ncbi:hypothetical protein BJ508DRAFT_302664 [Ascobolus immersus RN42]|uniref:BTB domain-containing protein n=1 Tax=Ascobolus immersus RN42 TaxID=1160509 RepID=A0A3N4II74_ASCIM|nr:hypothetical protein BJ508DRAFT_302664 [Ascobolus immersus RN42]
MNDLKIVRWKPEKFSKYDSYHNHPYQNFCISWSPLCFQLSSMDLIESAGEGGCWVSPKALVELENEKGDENPLLVLQAALFVWSKGELGGEKGSVTDFIDSLITGLGYVPDEKVEKYREDVLKRQQSGYPSLRKQRLPEDGRYIDLKPIIAADNLGKLFDLCQTDKISGSESDTGKVETREETLLKLPDYLGPDFTVILKGLASSEPVGLTSDSSTDHANIPQTRGSTRSRAKVPLESKANGRASRKRTFATVASLTDVDPSDAEPVAKRLRTANGSELKEEPERKQIEVELGRFHVHKCMLRMASEYFAGMFSGPWADSKTSTTTLHSEVAGTAFGLREALRFIYSASAFNNFVLAPSVNPDGTPGPLQPTPLFINIDDDTFLGPEKKITDYSYLRHSRKPPYDQPPPSISNFLLSLETDAQLEGYMQQNLSFLPASDYFGLERPMMANHPAIMFSSGLSMFAEAMERISHPKYNSFVSRLPLIFDDYPQLDYDQMAIARRKRARPDPLDEMFGPFEHYKKPSFIESYMWHFLMDDFKFWDKHMLEWPPHLVDLLINALRQRIDVKVKYGEKTPAYSLFISLGNFRRSIRSKARGDLAAWDSQIFGPLRTVLAEKIISIFTRSGHFHEPGETDEWVPEAETRLRDEWGELVRDWTPKNEKEKKLSVELQETAHKRLVMDPKIAGDIVLGYKYDYCGNERMDKEVMCALNDYLFWGFFAGLRKDRWEGKFHDEDLLDLLWRCTTLKGEEVVQRANGEACGGTGLLEESNVHAVEKLLDIFDCENMYCQKLKKVRGETVREVELVSLQMRRDSRRLLEEVHELRAGVERQKDDWASSQSSTV